MRGRTFLLSKDNGVTTANAAGGTANQVAFFDSAFQITGDSGFTFVPSTNIVTIGDGVATGALLKLSGPSGATSRMAVDIAGGGGYAAPNAASASDGDKFILFSDANNRKAFGVDASGNTWFSNYANSDAAPNGGFVWYTRSASNTITERWRMTRDGNIIPGADDSYALAASNNGIKQLFAAYTDTSASVTGSQTINKMAGSVNFASGMTTLVVTNSVVTTSSKVFASISTSGSSGVIGSIVPANGSFAINMTTAPGAETRVHWFVLSAN